MVGGSSHGCGGHARADDGRQGYNFAAAGAWPAIQEGLRLDNAESLPLSLRSRSSLAETSLMTWLSVYPYRAAE